MNMRRSARGNVPPEDGLATFVVLIAVMMASTIIAAAYAWARYETWSADRFLERQKMLAIARAAVGWGMHELLADATPDYDWPGDTWAKDEYPNTDAGVEVQVAITDEGSKINLNGEWQQLARIAGISASAVAGVQKQIESKGYLSDVGELAAGGGLLSSTELEKWFTTFGLYDVNVLSAGAWTHLLTALGLTPGDARRQAERILTAREESQVGKVADLFQYAAELKPLAGRLTPWLVVDGTVNINTAHAELVGKLMQAGGTAAGAIVARRSTEPFRSHADIDQAVGRQHASRPYLTMRSYVFRIRSVAQLAGSASQARVDAIVNRSRDERSGGWTLQIAAWQEAVGDV